MWPAMRKMKQRDVKYAAERVAAFARPVSRTVHVMAGNDMVATGLQFVYREPDRGTLVGWGLNHASRDYIDHPLPFPPLSAESVVAVSGGLTCGYETA